MLHLCFYVFRETNSIWAFYNLHFIVSFITTKSRLMMLFVMVSHFDAIELNMSKWMWFSERANFFVSSLNKNNSGKLIKWTRRRWFLRIQQPDFHLIGCILSTLITLTIVIPVIHCVFINSWSELRRSINSGDIKKPLISKMPERSVPARANPFYEI